MQTDESSPKINARERILAAAEEAFLSAGFEGVSVRELTDAAGANVALVNYYFGGKRNLYLEVLQRRFTAMAQEKCLRLQQALDALDSLNLRNVVTTYVNLYLASEETAQTTQQFLRMISLHFAEDDDAMELLLQELIKPIHQMTKEAIGNLAPQLSKEKISLSIGSINGQIFHFLRFPTTFQSLLAKTDRDKMRQEVAAHIIEFSVKGLQEVSPCDSAA